MVPAFTGSPVKRFFLIILTELILLIGLIAALLIFKEQTSRDETAAVRQSLYASHELAYQANNLHLMLAGLNVAGKGDGIQLKVSFERQAQRLMNTLRNNEGWLIPQNEATQQIKAERSLVENTLVNSLNAGRKMLAINESLKKLRSEGQPEALIHLMEERFDLHQRSYVALAQKNQSAFRHFIEQLESLHKTQFSSAAAKTESFIRYALLATALFALLQLSLCLIYRRLFNRLEHFLSRLENKVKTGFAKDLSAPFNDRLDTLTADVQQALDIQVSELQKQRWKNAALEAAGEAILIADARGNIQYTNAAFTRITGYDTSTVLGKNCSILSSGLTSLDTYNELWSGLNQNGLWHGELTNKRSNGDIFTQLTTISALYDENTDPPVHQGYIAVMRDISLRKELEQELYILARQDGLTGVLNRKTVLDEAEKKLQWSIRYDDPLSVIVLDIDHFKRVNDRWGHPAGDKVIVSIAERCQALLPSDGVMGRIGGEEFLLAVPGLNARQAFLLAEKLRQVIADQPLHLNHRDTIQVTCSFGISQLDRSAKNANGLLSQIVAQADKALYDAKEAGRNRVHIFHDKMMTR